MKKTAIRLIALALFCLASWCANAQENRAPKAPKWCSTKGYWVLETNSENPSGCTIYFYNNDHVLVYKATLKQNRLDVSRRKVRMILKDVLEKTVEYYAAGTARNDAELIAKLER